MVKHNEALRKSDYSTFLYKLIHTDIEQSHLLQPVASSSLEPS